jgi:DNA repair protein RadD
VLYQLATGGGKTHVFSYIALAAMAKGRRVLIIVHRRELLIQAVHKLALVGIRCGIIAADFPSDPDQLVQVCSIQTAVRRLDTLPMFALIIIDECHHAICATYRMLLDTQPKARLLGVTATPLRLDGRGLGREHGGLFDVIVCGPSINHLIGLGCLSGIRPFIPKSAIDLSGVRSRGGDYASNELAEVMSGAKIVGEAVEEWKTHAEHQPTICFTVTIEHAEVTAKAFRDAGYRSQCVSGKTPKKERDRLIAGLGTGEVEILCNCDLISEGLDVPSVGAVSLLRPTQSLGLFMQQVGRGMRPAPGKDALIVLDHVSNCSRHGPPDLERIWSLNGIEEPPKPPSKKKEPTGEGQKRSWETDPGFLSEITPERLELIRGLTYDQISEVVRSLRTVWRPG